MRRWMRRLFSWQMGYEESQIDQDCRPFKARGISNAIDHISRVLANDVIDDPDFDAEDEGLDIYVRITAEGTSISWKAHFILTGRGRMHRQDKGANAVAVVKTLTEWS